MTPVVVVAVVVVSAGVHTSSCLSVRPTSPPSARLSTILAVVKGMGDPVALAAADISVLACAKVAGQVPLLKGSHVGSSSTVPI